jgi:hypothetical protein
LTPSQKKPKYINSYMIEPLFLWLIRRHRGGRNHIKFVFTRFSTASTICRFSILGANQALISSVWVLPSGSVVLYYVPHVQLCILPEPVPHREQIQKAWQQCSKLKFFLLPQRVPNKEHSDRGNHGNQSVTSTLYYVQGDCWLIGCVTMYWLITFVQEYLIIRLWILKEPSCNLVTIKYIHYVL